MKRVNPIGLVLLAAGALALWYAQRQAAAAADPAAGNADQAAQWRDILSGIAPTINEAPGTDWTAIIKTIPGLPGLDGQPYRIDLQTAEGKLYYQQVNPANPQGIDLNFRKGWYLGATGLGDNLPAPPYSP